MKYKGYTAVITFDEKSKKLHGEVIDLDSTLEFDVNSGEEVEQEFHRVVDSYLDLCEKANEKPEKPFSGKMPFRTTPETHRQIYVAASEANKSVNAWMDEVLRAAVKKSTIDNTNPEDEVLGPVSHFFYKEHRDQYREILDALCHELGANGLLERGKMGRTIRFILKAFDILKPFGGEKDKILENLVDAIRSAYTDSTMTSPKKENKVIS